MLFYELYDNVACNVVTTLNHISYNILVYGTAITIKFSNIKAGNQLLYDVLYLPIVVLNSRNLKYNAITSVAGSQLSLPKLTIL